MKKSKQTSILAILLVSALSSPILERGINGYIPVTKDPENNQMFFWYFKSRTLPEISAPLVIWLNGGPGSSSMFGLAYENGPFLVDIEGNSSLNPHSWNTKANILYVDQPVGTGYSIGTPEYYARNKSMVEEYFYEFMVKFLELQDFKKFKGHPLYLTGESYAGHYIPQIGNKLYLSGNQDINLKGVAIGDGFINYGLQFPQYVNFAASVPEYTNVTQAQADQLMPFALLCSREMLQPNPFYAMHRNRYCSKVLNGITEDPATSKQKFNWYDIRDKEDYDESGLVKFFNRDDVKQELGIKDGVIWKPYNGKVGSALGKQDGTEKADLEIIPILNGGVKVLFYSGEFDFDCNWMGTRAVLDQLQWKGIAGYRRAEMKEGKYGLEKSFENLRFIKFKGSGHLVPFNQPELSLEMLHEFLDL